MIEEVTAIMQILADTIKVSGELALFGLAGYAVFKLVTIASFIMLARYCMHELMSWFKLATLPEKDRLEIYKSELTKK